MKIAVVSDDGRIVSERFDQAQFFVVITVEDGKMTQCELRHRQSLTQPCGQNHGKLPTRRHLSPINGINDCEVVLSGGMCRQYYENLEAHHINPVLTDIVTVGRALRTYLHGNLVSQAWRVHLYS